MKFNYPYKVYIAGLIFLMLVFAYGIVVLAEIFDEGRMKFVFLAIFMVVTFYLSKYYVGKIKYYIDMFLKIDKRTLIFHDHEIDVIIEEDNLDVIFYAKHMQNFKIHRVIHVFKNDGTYYYITNEINHFNKLTKLLQKTYPNKYYQTHELIKGFHEISKGFLFKFL